MQEDALCVFCLRVHLWLVVKGAGVCCEGAEVIPTTISRGSPAASPNHSFNLCTAGQSLVVSQVDCSPMQCDVPLLYSRRVDSVHVACTALAKDTLLVKLPMHAFYLYMCCMCVCVCMVHLCMYVHAWLC